MVRGSCLCGGIQFELDSAGIVESVCCYCSKCRKVSGSQFGVYLQVKRRCFRWISGAGEIESYESSPGNRRAFCKTCGSIAPIATNYGAIRVPAGALDEDPGTTPSVVICEGDRAMWFGSANARQTFSDTGPQEFWMGMIGRLLER